MILTMENICKSYYRGKNEVPVLHDICLSVEKGDYLAIMGPSGSGKTTLMNLLGCLDKPTSGSYHLEGEDISAKKDNALAELRNRYIGFVFQSFYLMPGMNALENVALPLMYAGISKRERLERAREALRGVGLEDRMKFLPNQLSGGQCQRVAIARAMAGKPALLLADEPTGALDTASGEQIMDLFDQINAEGSTIIMITHEASIAARAKTVCHIRDGRLSVPGEEAL
jgi:ABC-type antimicrobial peptide transport system, ATPase component